jgi:hypothetical protein
MSVIDLSQQLDKEITLLQKIMQEVRPIKNWGDNATMMSY